MEDGTKAAADPARRVVMAAAVFMVIEKVVYGY